MILLYPRQDSGQAPAVLALQADVVGHLFRDFGPIKLCLNLVLVLIRLLRDLNTLDDSGLIVNLGQQLPLLDLNGSILDPFSECEGEVCLLAVQDRVFKGRLRPLIFYRSLPPSLVKVLLGHVVAALERESNDFLAGDTVLIC